VVRALSDLKRLSRSRVNELVLAGRLEDNFDWLALNSFASVLYIGNSAVDSYKDQKYVTCLLDEPWTVSVEPPWTASVGSLLLSAMIKVVM